MRTMLIHSMLIAMLLIAPALGDSLTITGVKNGQTVLTLSTTIHGDFPLPQIDGLRYTIRFAPGDTPIPPPDNPDDPDDPDPLPEGKYKIQRQVRDWANAVNHPDRATTATELAKNYRQTLPGIVSLVGAKTPQEALEVSQLLTLGVVGAFQGGQQAWQAFGTNLNTRIAQLISSGQVTSVAEFLELSAEVATGLEAAVSPAEKRAALGKQLRQLED